MREVREIQCFCVISPYLTCDFSSSSGQLRAAQGSLWPPCADILLCTSFASVLELLQCHRDGGSTWAQLHGFLLPRLIHLLLSLNVRSRNQYYNLRVVPYIQETNWPHVAGGLHGIPSTLEGLTVDCFSPRRGNGLSYLEFTPTLDTGLSFISGTFVSTILWRLEKGRFADSGPLVTIVLDQGSYFTATKVWEWAHDYGIDWHCYVPHYIEATSQNNAAPLLDHLKPHLGGVGLECCSLGYWTIADM